MKHPLRQCGNKDTSLEALKGVDLVGGLTSIKEKNEC